MKQKSDQPPFFFFGGDRWRANLRRRLGWSDEEQNAGHGDAWVVRRRIIHWGGTPVRNYDNIQIYTVYTSNKEQFWIVKL